MTDINGQGRWVLLHVVGMGDVYAFTTEPVDKRPLVVSRLTIARTLPTPDGLILALGKHPGYDRGLRHGVTIEITSNILRSAEEAPRSLVPTLEKAWSPVQLPNGQQVADLSGGRG